MIPLLLGLFAVGVLIVANWDDIVNWLKETIPQIISAIRTGGLDGGLKVLIYKVMEEGRKLIGFIQRLFYQREDGQWVERTTEREIGEEEVPEDILAKVKEKEKVDITDEVKEKLELEI
jgi:hypothetical protein